MENRGQWIYIEVDPHRYNLFNLELLGGVPMKTKPQTENKRDMIRRFFLQAADWLLYGSPWKLNDKGAETSNVQVRALLFIQNFIPKMNPTMPSAHPQLFCLFPMQSRIEVNVADHEQGCCLQPRQLHTQPSGSWQCNNLQHRYK